MFGFMNYHQRLVKVLDFIGKQLDEEITLEQLSEIACLSKFHFHRLFTAWMGISLQDYIRWLRLKRAAHQLIVHKDRPIIEIAISAGFESQEAFSRAFKRVCGLNPGRYRKEDAYWLHWEKPPYCLLKSEESKMHVDIRKMNAKR